MSNIKRANELILEGLKYKELDSLKTLQISAKDAQIDILQDINARKDTIIFSQEEKLAIKDSVIHKKDAIIDVKDKQVKKWKKVSICSGS